MFEVKKYHGDRVMSLTYDDDQQSFSVGILSPGEYAFGAIKRENFTVTSGVINAQVEGSDVWSTHGKNDTFVVPDHKNFKLSVNQVSTYICYYE